MGKEANELDFEVYFGREKVRVIVPVQADDRRLYARRLPFPDVEEEQDDFKFTRPVINFQVQREDESIVETFDPPMQVTVGLLESDYEVLEEGEKLKLAFWDDDDQRWILFTEKKHGLVIDDEKLEASVSITHWGDPGLGAGRK